MPEVLTHNQLTAIAEEFGTPVYIYHAEKIAEQYQKLKDAFAQQDVVFFYASKALTNINVLKYMKSVCRLCSGKRLIHFQRDCF